MEAMKKLQASPLPLPFSPLQIRNTQTTMENAPGSNPYVYPAVDWLDLLFKNQVIDLLTGRRLAAIKKGQLSFSIEVFLKDAVLAKIIPIQHDNSSIEYKR
jgi:hypothetical protein